MRFSWFQFCLIKIIVFWEDWEISAKPVDLTIRSILFKASFPPLKKNKNQPNKKLLICYLYFKLPRIDSRHDPFLGWSSVYFPEQNHDQGQQDQNTGIFTWERWGRRSSLSLLWACHLDKQLLYFQSVEMWRICSNSSPPRVPGYGRNDYLTLYLLQISAGPSLIIFTVCFMTIQDSNIF